MPLRGCAFRLSTGPCFALVFLDVIPADRSTQRAFFTRSMEQICFLRPLLPPAIPNRHLQAHIDARILVAEAGARDVHRIGAEINRAARLDEVVNTRASLRSKVPHTGIGLRSCLGRVARVQVAHSRVLVIRPDHSARRLHPRHKALAVRKVPTHHDRRDAGSRISTAYGIRIAALGRDRCARGAGKPLKLRRIRLPERKDFDGVLNVSLEQARTDLRGKDLAGMSADEQEAIVGPVLQSYAALEQRAVLPRGIRGGIRHRRTGQASLGSGWYADCQRKHTYDTTHKLLKLHSTPHSRKPPLEWRLSHLPDIRCTS